MKSLKTNKIVVALMLVCLCASSFTLSAQSKGDLLYQGYYTETEHRWPAGNTMMAMMERKEILIYEDRLEIYNVLSNGTDWSWKSIIPFKSIQNGRRVYKESGGFMDVTAVVDANFNISCSDTGGGTFQYVKDGVSQGSNYGGGGNNPTPVNPTSPTNPGGTTPTQSHGRTAHQVTKTCLSCGGSGKCGSCNGTHRINYQFGSGTVECPNCRPNGACSKCGGSGKITVTEWY